MKDPRIVIVSGYSFSGSSALLDFFLDHRKVARLPGGECRLFASRHAFLCLVHSIQQHGVVTEEALRKCMLFLDGQWTTGVDYYDKRIQVLVRSLKEGVGDAYAKALMQFEFRIMKKPGSVPVVVKAARQFVGAICRLVAVKEKAHTIVLDQAVRPWTLDRLRFFPPSHVFLVRRDIRDQLIDRICNGLPEENFAATMRKRADKASKFLGKPGRHQVSELWFEDMVLDRGKRRDVRNLLNLSSTKKKNFNPIASRKNIGRYQSRPDLLGEVASVSRDLLYTKSLWVRLTSWFGYLLDLAEFLGSARKNTAGRIRKTVPLEGVPVRHRS